MISTQNWKMGRPLENLNPQWEGPFRVIKISPHTVTVDLPQNRNIYPTFHVSNVQLRSSERAPGQEDEDIKANDGRTIVRTDGQRDVVEYHFGKIVGYEKMQNNRWHYQVQWTAGDTTWEPASH